MTRFGLTAVLYIVGQVVQLINGQGCDSGPCKNDALCEDRSGGYECFCVNGYAGPNCEIDFDDCVSAPCRNNATCIDGVASYTCACAPGFTGAECQEDIDECLSVPCLRNGTCINIVNRYACECLRPFKGDNCELLPCDTLPCENDGSCRNDLNFNESVSGFACDCQVGFTGQRCEINIEDCDLENDTSCFGNGLCVDGVNEFSCLCAPGWVGKYCASPVNDCIDNECRNGANCTDRHLGYDCECPTGYDGSLCERDRDECEVYNSCQNGGLCVDLFDSYRCECAEGWYGVNCTEEVNECRNNPCKNGATCIDIVGGYQCRCAPFYTGPLCKVQYNPCGPEYNPCQNGARCLTPPDGQYRCFCERGFTGVHCEVDLDECFSHPCQNNATCEDITAGYICYCTLGWEGQNCELNKDECESQPCFNGAECFDLLNDFECNCTREYTGRLCDKMRNFCEKDPCFHQGMCISILGDYQCLCNAPYTGRQCLNSIDACISQPCANGGTCFNTLDGAMCNCPPQYSGDTCTEMVNFCASRPCWNGGTCRNGLDGYLCVCPELLTGKQCTDIIDYCKDEPCKNDAFCINDASKYRCSCLYGFTGVNCTDLIDFCVTDPCQHSANCSNIPGGFLCDCLPGYNGEFCENIVQITSYASSLSPVTSTNNMFHSSFIVSFKQSSDLSESYTQSDISPTPASMYALSTSHTTQMLTSVSLVSSSIFFSTDAVSESHRALSSKSNLDHTTSRTFQPTQKSLSNIRTTEFFPSYTLPDSSLHYSKTISTNATAVFSDYTSRIFQSAYNMSSPQANSRLPSVSENYIVSRTSSTTFGFSTIYFSSEFVQSIHDSKRSVFISSSTLDTFSTKVEKYPSFTTKSSNNLQSKYLTDLLSISITADLFSLISSSPFQTEPTSQIIHYITTMYETTLDSSFKVFETVSHSSTLLRSFTPTLTELTTTETHMLTNPSFLQTPSSEILSSEELYSFFGTDTSVVVTSQTSINSSFSSHVIQFFSSSSLQDTASTNMSSFVKENHTTDRTDKNTMVSSSNHSLMSSIFVTTHITDTPSMTASKLMSSKSSTHKREQTSHVVSVQSSFTSVLPSELISLTMPVASSMLVSLNTKYFSSLSFLSVTTYRSHSDILLKTSSFSMLASSSISNNLSGSSDSQSTLSSTDSTVPLSSIAPSMTEYVFSTISNSMPFPLSHKQTSKTPGTNIEPYASSSSLHSTSESMSFSNSNLLSLNTAKAMESSIHFSSSTRSIFTSVPSHGATSVSLVSVLTLMTSYDMLSMSLLQSTLLEMFVSSTPFIHQSSSFKSSVTEQYSSVSEKSSRMSTKPPIEETRVISNINETLSSVLEKSSRVSVSSSVMNSPPSVSELASQIALKSSIRDFVSSEFDSKVSQRIVTQETSSLLITSLHSYQPSVSITRSLLSHYTSPVKTYEFDTSSIQQMSLSKHIVASSVSPQQQTSPMIATFTGMPGDTITTAMTSLSSSKTITMSSVSSTTPLPNASCDSQVCLNSGTCREDRFGLYCDCADRFIGEMCETETSVCDGFVCENGGYCSVTMTTFGTQLPRCNCPLPFVGTRCNSELIIFFPSLLGSSYMELPSPQFSPDQFNEIYVSIKTTSADGTIFYSASGNQITNEQSQSFVHLRLVNGLPVFDFTCDGSVHGTIAGNRKVNTGDIYEIVIRQVWPAKSGQWCSAALVVNGHSYVSGPLLTVAAPQALGHLYLGAVPRYSYSDDVISATHVTDGFVGCIHNLQINNKEIDMISMAKHSVNIENCNVPVCQHSPCKNGGKCHSTGEEWYCSCSHGYAGTFCERKLCHADPCHHGGTCVILEEEGDQLCMCPYNRGGILCEEEISITIPHYSGTQFGHTSYSAYARPHYLVDEFEAEFYMTLNENSHVDNVVMYMGTSGSGDDRKDFMALGMHRGYLVFRFDLGSGYGEIYSQEPLDLSLAYHHVRFGRNGNRAWLQPDSQHNSTGRSRGPLVALNTKSMLYVGGYPNDMKTLLSEKARFEDGLKGCVYHLRFRTHDSHFIEPGSPPGHVVEGRNVMQCTTSSCQDGLCHNGADCVDLGASVYCNCTDGWKGPTCLDVHTVCDVTNSCADGSTCVPMIPDSYRCLCSLGKRGDRCEEAFSISDPLFADEDSYMAFEPVFIRQKTDVLVQIKPHTPDGLLFYASQHLHSNAGDFLAVTMHTGTVQLRYDLGSGLNVIRSPISIENDEWQTIEAGRNSTHGYLTINGHRIVVMTTGVTSYLDTTTEFYLGGVPRLSEVTPEAFENDPVTFRGCIRQLSVSGRQYDLTEFGAVHGKNIDDCDKTPCGYSVCKHGGICTSGSGSEFECNCTKDFFGFNCEHPIECLNNTCLHGNCRVTDEGGYECECFIGWAGSSCDQELSLGTAARISAGSFVVFSDPDMDTRNKSHTYLGLMFKTSSLNGLILWHGQTYSEEEDYLGIGLDNGRLKVVWNLGWYSSSDVITPQRYNDGVWHAIFIEIDSQQMVFGVDGNKYYSSVSGDFYELDTQGRYYVGGFKQGSIRESTLGFFTEALDMCVENLRFHDSNDVIFDTASDGINIRACD